MKKLSKQHILLPFQLALSLSVLFWLGSCTSECDTSNSTTVIAGFDTAGRTVALNYWTENFNGDTIIDLSGNRRTDTSAIFLDLLADSTTVRYNVYYPVDSIPVEEEITFTYSSKAFARGPDCGIDIRVKDLQISSYTTQIIDTVFFVQRELTSSNNFNVKIRLKRP